MLDNLIKILKVIYDNEDIEKITLDFLSKKLKIEKKELYKILKNLEKEGYLEERKYPYKDRKYLDKKGKPIDTKGSFTETDIQNDFALEYKGSKFIDVLIKADLLSD